MNLRNVVDMTQIIRRLKTEGQKVSRETLARLNPYLTQPISSFGNYRVDLNRLPQPLDVESELMVWQKRSEMVFNFPAALFALIWAVPEIRSCWFS